MLVNVLAVVPQKKIVVAFAGDARYRGADVQTVLEAGFKMPQADMDRMTSAGMPTSTLALDKYAQSATMIVNGTLVPRRHLIKYVANKLGGVHHDRSRKNDDENRDFKEAGRCI